MEAESVMVSITIQLPVELYNRMERQAIESGMSLNDYVVYVLTKAVGEKEV